MIWKQLQQYPASEGAFRRVMYIEPENEFARVELAETLLYASNGAQLPEASRELLDSVLAENPDNQKALWLAGLGAFHEGNEQRALRLWTRLRDLLPEGNVRQRVSDQIAEVTDAPAPEPAAEPAPMPMANPHAGIPGMSQAGTDTPGASAPDDSADADSQQGASIQVEVTVEPSLIGRLAGSETVFVFARAVNGPPAPLAVKRLSASDLPTTVTLSDGDSMAQGLSLSVFPQVQISARISSSGNAIASAGDLQGQSGPITVQETDQITITIDQIIE
jgi:cytochrome c-type biogenesis protein CcmH